MSRPVWFVEIRHLLSREDADLHRAFRAAARSEERGSLARRAKKRLRTFEGEMAEKYIRRVDPDRSFQAEHCPECGAVWDPLNGCRECGQPGRFGREWPVPGLSIADARDSVRTAG